MKAIQRASGLELAFEYRYKRANNSSKNDNTSYSGSIHPSRLSSFPALPFPVTANERTDSSGLSGTRAQLRYCISRLQSPARHSPSAPARGANERADKYCTLH
ncbi:hypothetical protein AVEN_25037-1 [Araneus ventricosus]|uniref:Uncharacterized protein n=1 Tax=Araneus ventricosus TaxID=182803 RepID=A0A4Y2V6Z3_ARAVE|nr:hypothetical protein AVEN_25037-1 [Araneus ventricosus]